MKNTHEMRENLSEVWKDLREGKIQAKDAAEFSNMAGKFIASAKLDLEYQQLVTRVPATKPIPFLVNPEEKPKAIEQQV